MTQTRVEWQTWRDVDADLLRFLREQVNTFVKWDLINFFHHNPHAADTAENIARYIGRDVPNIADELVELAKKNVLKAREVSGKTIFSLAPDQATRNMIDRFVGACDDRMFRMQAIYRVIQP
jgi:hypothetical protein